VRRRDAGRPMRSVAQPHLDQVGSRPTSRANTSPR
jgi:hypothetical protein